MLLKYLKHFLNPKLCVKNLYVDDNDVVSVIKCKECTRELGFIYHDGIEWKTFIHFACRGNKLEIERWVREYTKNRSGARNTSECEWGTMLLDHKQWCEDYICAMGYQTGDGKREEDSKGNEPDGIGKKYGAITDNLCVIQG